jgi:predicted amidophosphoribosyltransferase
MDSLTLYVMIFFIVTTSLFIAVMLRSHGKHHHNCPFCGNKVNSDVTTCDKCIGV